MKEQALFGAELIKILSEDGLGCIAIEVVWEPDLDARWEEIAGCFSPDTDPDDWQPWQSEVKVSVISGGKLLSGSAYLCGTWEKATDHPSESNPDLSGYLPQMIRDAAEELLKEKTIQVSRDPLQEGKQDLDERSEKALRRLIEKLDHETEVRYAASIADQPTR